MYRKFYIYRFLLIFGTHAEYFVSDMFQLPDSRPAAGRLVMAIKLFYQNNIGYYIFA